MILVIIFLIIVIAGCTEKQAPETEMVAEYPEELGDLPHPITFNEGINLMNRRLCEDLAKPYIASPLYYAEGRSVNREGKAEQWIFGTSADNQYFFVIVDINQQILIPYPSNVSEKSINIQRIIYPDTLVTKNIQLIQKSFGKTDDFPPVRIELADTTYTVTSTTGNVSRILYFNAFTGNPINP